MIANDCWPGPRGRAGGARCNRGGGGSLLRTRLGSEISGVSIPVRFWTILGIVIAFFALENP